jgi:hypothetical protein
MTDSIVETYTAALARSEVLVKEVQSLRRIIEVCARRAGGSMTFGGIELLKTTGDITVYCDNLTGLLHVSAEELPGDEGVN